MEATGSRVFELGHPALVQGYSVDVGGDILGSAAELSASGSGSGSSGSSGSSDSSGSSGSSNIKGTINQTIKHDAKAFDFWESLEKSLVSMLHRRDGTAAAPSGAAQPAAATQPAADTSTSDPRQNVVINRLTGTIMVTATRRNLVAIEQYLDLVKAALGRQVLVEARVVEVQLNDGLQFGIDWDFLDSIRWFNTSGSVTGGFGNAANSASSALTGGAFRLGYSGNNVQSLLTALKTQGEVKTLSNPRIHVMNGQTALLTVGRNTNYVSKITSTTTATSGTPITTFTVDTSNVLSGIMIGLAPHINSKGEISMSVTPIISDLVQLEEKAIGTDVNNQFVISIPTVDLRELSTTVKVRNGEMIVIGGLIANKQDQVDEKIPFIGDIPWFGTLFSRKNYQDKRSELVVVLQPYLIGSN